MEPVTYKGRFTGRHAAMILVAFFAVVIAVNVLMARLATSTFGGLVVENSYVASQDFNRWLDEAAREKALGWSARFERGAGGEIVLALADRQGNPLAGAKVTVDAVHPLGRQPDHQLAVRELGQGRYAAPLEPGRWRLRVQAVHAGVTWRTIGDVE